MTNPQLIGIIGTILITTSYIPYIYNILKGSTKPHIFTWILWTLTHAFAATAIIEGGGGWFSAVNIGVGSLLAFVILLLSLKHGSRNVTKFDTVALIAGCCAAVIWWYFDHPVIAIFMVTIIEIVGFMPTYRKSWHEPRSESVFAWSLFVLGCLCAIYALDTYNLLTSLYIISMTCASCLLVLICLGRRGTL